MTIRLQLIVELCDRPPNESDMLLSGPSAAKSGHLIGKMRYRPTAVVERLLPAGSDRLDGIPRMRSGASRKELFASEPTASDLAAYEKAIRATARVFAKYHHQTGTLAEHDHYVVWVDTWCNCRVSVHS